MAVRIGLGAAGIPFSTPASFARWVDLCERTVVDSIWFSDRLVSASPMLEPMTAMSFLAGRTERLKFGMNAVVLPFRDPLVLAKECATLDYLSNGRLLPVFGVGNEIAPEFSATARPAKGRGMQSDEMITIMSRLWAGETVSFQGKHYQYENVQICPLPVQQPLPLWIGGSSDAAIRRTAQIGTGWLGGVQTPAQVAPVVEKIRNGAAAAGRPLDPDHYGAGFAFRFGSWDDPIVEKHAAGLRRLGPDASARDYFAVGTADDIIARVEEYLEAGMAKFVLRPIAADDAEVMDQTQRLIDTVIPRMHT